MVYLSFTVNLLALVSHSSFTKSVIHTLFICWFKLLKVELLHICGGDAPPVPPTPLSQYKLLDVILLAHYFLRSSTPIRILSHFSTSSREIIATVMKLRLRFLPTTLAEGLLSSLDNDVPPSIHWFIINLLYVSHYSISLDLVCCSCIINSFLMTALQQLPLPHPLHPCILQELYFTCRLL